MVGLLTASLVLTSLIGIVVTGDRSAAASPAPYSVAIAGCQGYFPPGFARIEPFIRLS
jgi:hypothetical protein